ncbi:MAG TPA: alpha-amylase family glycosyl hydrolase, partial [Phycisphaerae bacterium]
MPFTLIQSPSAGGGMGCILLPGATSAQFRIWAPNALAAQVLLRADPADSYQSLDLTQQNNPEYWSADITGIAPGFQYRFNMLNDSAKSGDNPGGQFERVDPRARRVRNDAVDSPGYILDPAFPFAPFTPVSPDQYLVYQLQVGSFRGKNDSIQTAHNSARFTDVIPKLQHIKNMNFTAIQLLPAGEFPTDTGEGYAPTNFFSPESGQGTPDELRQLVDACHTLGLAVLFDVIYNHVPDDDDNLWQLDGNYSNRGGGIYFADVDRSPWGWRLATDRPAVHDFFLDNARMWLTEFNGDGLRFDSVHNIYPEGGAWWLLTDIAGNFPQKMLIAEHDNPGWALGRYPIEGAWDMAAPDKFRNDVLAGRSVDNLKSLIEFWGAPHAANYIRYLLGSHDQVFNQCDAGGWKCGDCRYFVERVAGIGGRDDWTARAKARLGWALNITMPGTPMLFMGEEVHHYGYWCPTIDQY